MLGSFSSGSRSIRSFVPRVMQSKKRGSTSSKMGTRCARPRSLRLFRGNFWQASPYPKGHSNFSCRCRSQGHAIGVSVTFAPERSSVLLSPGFFSSHRKRSLPLSLLQGLAPLSLDPDVAQSLLAWRRLSPFNREADWVFASPDMGGKQPYWPENLLRRHIRPAARRCGIEKRIGWHTFRHYLTFLTMSSAIGQRLA